jgi:type I restriction enzyme S subunit
MTNKNIPKLRFEEFSKNWESKKLGEISTIITGKTPSTFNSLYWNGDILFITPTDINESKKYQINTQRKITKQINTKILPVGSIVYSCVASIGKMAITTLISSTNQQLNSLIVHNDFYNEYVYYSLLELTPWIKSIKTNSTPAIINKTDFSNFKINIPEIKEQTKIANFLSVTDKKIQQFNQKQQLLQNYKNGVMQQIFSQKIRFKNDDCDLPDWENKKLGDIGKTFNGLTGKTKIDFGKGKPYIQYKQIFDNSKINTYNFGLVNITDNDKQNRAKYGDVFFTTSSETPEEVGYSSVLLDDIKELYLNSFCFGYRPNSLDELNPNFLQYLFRNNLFRKPIRRLAQGSTRYNISKIQTMKISVNIPEIKEQTKIANFLSVLDKKINLLIQQTDISKDFKKSLLQKMFV